MIALIDSGSTKADWRIFDRAGLIVSCQTVGMNPYFVSSTEVLNIINQCIPVIQKAQNIHEVYFYGAGCGSVDKRNMILTALKQIFPNSIVSVDSDMVGAAKALFGNKTGIAAILGTGANSCLWDGNQIVQNAPSLGYIIGDEGSGAHLGLSLIRKYLHNQLPQDIKTELENKYPVSRDIILENVYKKPNPNRYLAQFTYFIKESIDHQFMKFIVTGCFLEFMEKYIKYYNGYNKYEIGCIGSVAYAFKEIFNECAIASECDVVKIISSPIDELIQIYSKE